MKFKDLKKLFIRRVNPEKEVVDVHRDLHEEITIEFGNMVVTGPPHLVAEFVGDVMRIQEKDN